MESLRREVNDKVMTGKLMYMKKLPNWLSSEGWLAYQNDHDVDETLEEPKYGTSLE
jgi:hypothetical protein